MRVKRRFDLAVLALVAVLCSGNAAPAADSDRDIEQLERGKFPVVKAPATPARGQTPLRVKVLVLDFDPMIPGHVHSPDDPNAKPKGLREVGRWNDPIPLAAGYMQDVCDASGGLIQYEIAEWLVVRRFQKKTDGFVYTPESYVECLRNWKHGTDPWHKPDGLDYPHMVKEFDLARWVESGQIDEVWMMGLPFFGYWESAMAGQDAFYINGGVYDQVPCKRRFVIMGFNVERGVAEMLHDLCHRTESTMSRIYGGWKVDQLTDNWARFAANEKQSGTAAVGTCHFPPNGENHYDYANKRMVESTADDWRHYPNLTGRKRTFNCEEWSGPYRSKSGQPDYHRNFMRWWFTHLPKAVGVNDDGRLNNWWEYLYNFNAYDEPGRPLPAASPPKGTKGEKAAFRRPA